VGEVAQYLNAARSERIRETDYGGGVHIGIVLMCRGPELAFHRRIRFNKKSGLFGIDVMLNHRQMKEASHSQRCAMAARALMHEIPPIIAKRNISGFQSETFIEDFKSWVASLLAQAA
jgi:hypothetical protein